MENGAGVCDLTKLGSARMVTIDGGFPGFGNNVTQPLIGTTLASKTKLAPNFKPDFRTSFIASTPQLQQGAGKGKPQDFDRPADPADQT